MDVFFSGKGKSLSFALLPEARADWMTNSQRATCTLIPEFIAILCWFRNAVSPASSDVAVI